MADNIAFEGDGKTFENVDLQTTSFGSQKTASRKNSQIEEQKISIDVTSDATSKEIPAPYAGMPKEVLLHYSRQKKFVWARNILAGAVILTILILLSMVIALIAVSPHCQQFWQTSPIYQIYPKSFKDSDDSGIGDLVGIMDELEYLNDVLGVSTIWLNPVYKSPQVDNGYDVMDYRAIDDRFGTMEDMEELITELHNRGMHIIMDFVPNHTSNLHQWFNVSSDPCHPDHEFYKDYYVWVNSTDGTENGIPNNWQSVFSNESSAWEWNEKREQFYYHAFYKEQPDLNLRNPAVQQELKDILSFWMDKGIDGFRCDAVAFMFEATHLRDNPIKNESLPPSYENVWPDYTENQLGIHDVIADWRKLLQKYSSEPGVYRFMETEVYNDVDTVVRYYGTPHVKEADFPMNFQLIDLADPTAWTAQTIEATIMEWMEKMPEGKWPNWVLGNHDNPRVVSRLGETKAKLAAVLSLTLSGTPGMYYGEEIGMINGTNSTGPITEDFRNPARTPMQWTPNVTTAGFCETCTPWLPVNGDYLTKNVQKQADDTESMLWMYKKLISMRSDVTFLRGSLCILESSNTTSTLMYVREMPGAWSTLVAINFDENDDDNFNLNALYPANFPTSGTLTFQSSVAGGEIPNTQVIFSSVIIPKGEAMVVSFKPPGGSSLFSRTASTEGRCFVSRKVCVNVLGLLEVC